MREMDWHVGRSETATCRITSAIGGECRWADGRRSSVLSWRTIRRLRCGNGDRPARNEIALRRLSFEVGELVRTNARMWPKLPACPQGVTTAIIGPKFRAVGAPAI